MSETRFGMAPGQAKKGLAIVIVILGILMYLAVKASS